MRLRNRGARARLRYVTSQRTVTVCGVSVLRFHRQHKQQPFRAWHSAPVPEVSAHLPATPCGNGLVKGWIWYSFLALAIAWGLAYGIWAEKKYRKIPPIHGTANVQPRAEPDTPKVNYQ